MAINQSQGPYFDDYDDTKNFSKILFKPGVPVQVRELNQLQTILQQQIRRFGDNVLKQGTIVSGCQVTTHNNLNYVKIKDNDSTGTPVNLNQLTGLYIQNSSNTVGIIATSIAGAESTGPDLNTLYVKYINSGLSGTATSFNPNELLTVYNPSRAIYKTTIQNGSAGYSNTDSIYFASALLVTNTTGGNSFPGSLHVGDNLTSGNGANVIISTITSNGSVTALTFVPRMSDRIAGNTVAWQITSNTVMSNANTGGSLVVSSLSGSQAAASLTTDGSGAIVQINQTSGGIGYQYLPSAFVVSTTANTTQLQNTIINPQNYNTQFTIASANTSPVGTGYGVSITEGVVYHNGHFTRAANQLLVVSKYTNIPGDVAVGFTTSEEITTYVEDTSLFDNVQGSNRGSIGADRLKITAKGIVVTKTQADNDPLFLSIIQFSDGAPYSLDPQTQYNVIEQELAKRTAEESGNFVVDPFKLNTRSVALAQENSSYSVVIDPGVAYINGFRVATVQNYSQSVPKGITTKIVSQVPTSIDYGNYVVVNSFSGVFGQLIGSIVNLTDTVSTLPIGNAIVNPGITIGNARIRSIVPLSRTGNPQYKIYFFDISMLPGYNFGNVRSVFAANLIANIVLTNGIAVLADSNAGTSLFQGPVNAIKSLSNVSFTYPKENWGTTNVSSSGQVTLILTGSETFVSSGTQTSDQLDKISVILTSNTIGTAVVSSTGTTVSGSPLITSATALSFQPNDYVYVSNSTANVVGQVLNVVNSTAVTLTSTMSTTIANANIAAFYPARVPLRPQSGNVSTDLKTLVLNIATNVPSTTVTPIVPVISNSALSSKTVSRNLTARIGISTNIGLVTGPWALGFSDVIRLNGVFKGANTTFLSTDSGVFNVTNDYYIDSNHSVDYLNTGYLYRKQKATSSLNSADNLLVVFDILSNSGSGVRTVSSYPVADNVQLANASSTINTLELPEVFGYQGAYFDIRDCFDFRPVAANTVAPTTSQSIAPLNPTEPSYVNRFATAGPFPLPQSIIRSDIEYYLGRTDRVVVNSAGKFNVLQGIAGSTVIPNQPTDAITINTLTIPPYPSLPAILSTDLALIADTKISNERFSGQRIKTYTIVPLLSSQQIEAQQPRGYTMADIGRLDRRLGAVEYYVALNYAETHSKNRFVPSGNNPSTDRFKFGLFVDSFVDANYSDLSNPQYSANISKNIVGPVLTKTIINFKPASGSSKATLLPFTETAIASQLTASQYIAPPAPPAPPIVYAPPITAVIPTAVPTPVVVTIPAAIPAPVVTYLPPVQFNFAGTVIDINPPEFETSLSASVSYTYDYAPAQKFTITVIGLKPLTTHMFAVEGTDQTGFCSPNLNTLLVGTPLVSDATGKLVFDYAFGGASAATDFLRFNEINRQNAGAKAIKVSNIDNTSSAQGTIGIKPYVNAALVYYVPGLSPPSAVPLDPPVVTSTASISKPASSLTVYSGGGGTHMFDDSRYATRLD